MPELLAPAGDIEKLEWAAAYGADAVYFGMKDFSLRSFAGNLTLDEADKGLKILHGQNKKGYVTLNIYPYSNEYPKLVSTARTLEEIGADAFIVSDLGVLAELKKHINKTPIHISTQANTISYQAVLAYRALGAKRVNLARELTLERIKEIQKNIKGDVETEVFIHGSVCFSYSGRCAISDYMTGRSANRGECTHPCRWKYYLVEETREGEFYPVFEDNRGFYFLNSKDLALFPFIKDLISCGVNSFKIEGRMKTIHYIATTVSFYKRILNGEDISIEEGLKILSRVSNRGYSYGFMKGGITPEDYNFDNSTANATSSFVANTCENSKKHEGSLLRVRNRIFAGESLEVLSPGGDTNVVELSKPLLKEDGSKVDVVHNGDYIVIEDDIPKYSILRRVTNSS